MHTLVNYTDSIINRTVNDSNDIIYSESSSSTFDSLSNIILIFILRYNIIMFTLFILTILSCSINFIWTATPFKDCGSELGTIQSFQVTNKYQI